MTTKSLFRGAIKRDLKLVSPSDIARQSTQARVVISLLPRFKAAKTVGLYLNMPHLEIQTIPLVQECFNAKKRVFLPRCIFEEIPPRKKNHMEMLEVRSMDEVKALVPQGPYNLREPHHGSTNALSCGLDVLIVPGVAFSPSLHRLGHGAGFYDEYLSYYTATWGSKPYILGVGLRQQLQPEVPTEKHDWNLDGLVIADKLYGSSE